MSDLVVRLLPFLGGAGPATFNVFDVMRHGTHEKQISNVFAWLLTPDATHGLGDDFQRIFVSAVNANHPGPGLPTTGYAVHQEQNTQPSSIPGADIADLVLESPDAALVIENYFTSDGHGHSFEGYLSYGQSLAADVRVVMLCATQDQSLLRDGWQRASVVTYADLLTPLLQRIASDARYREAHPDQCVFLAHLHRRYVKDLIVNNDDLLHFVEAMCESGAAQYYQAQSVEAGAQAFATSLQEAARDQFTESRVALQRVKTALKNYCATALTRRLNQALGAEVVGTVSARYQGIYQWTINFEVAAETSSEGGEAPLQIKFGPSAWWANERDPGWIHPVERPDYSRLFLTHWRQKRIVQSSVRLDEVLDGLAADDHRLCDEIVALLATARG